MPGSLSLTAMHRLFTLALVFDMGSDCLSGYVALRGERIDLSHAWLWCVTPRRWDVPVGAFHHSQARYRYHWSWLKFRIREAAKHLQPSSHIQPAKPRPTFH